MNTGMPWFGYRYISCSAFPLLQAIIVVSPLNLLHKGVFPGISFMGSALFIKSMNIKNLSILAYISTPLLVFLVLGLTRLN